MIYGVLTPISFAIGLYLVPLMIGAAEIAAPARLPARQLADTARGASMVIGLGTANGAAKAGWTAYTPLSNAAFTPGRGHGPVDHGRVLRDARDPAAGSAHRAHDHALARARDDAPPAARVLLDDARHRA